MLFIVFVCVWDVCIRRIPFAFWTRVSFVVVLLSVEKKQKPKKKTKKKSKINTGRNGANIRPNDNGARSIEKIEQKWSQNNAAKTGAGTVMVHWCCSKINSTTLCSLWNCIHYLHFALYLSVLALRRIFVGWHEACVRHIRLIELIDFHVLFFSHHRFLAPQNGLI